MVNSKTLDYLYIIFEEDEMDKLIERKEKEFFQELKPVRSKLLQHQLYNNIKSIEDLNIFLETHVYAVWDFMSLLKALQRELTCITVPWVPTENPFTRRLINEIVLGEESDLDAYGRPTSHFEMYLDAMKQTKADTSQMEIFIAKLKEGREVRSCLHEINLHSSVYDFIDFSFKVISSGKIHLIAAAFTFGREDLIPEMFTNILTKLRKSCKVEMNKLIFYFDRHIELDSDSHGPLAMHMMVELCGKDEDKWAECLAISKLALEKRLNLWNYILEEIKERKAVTA